MSRNMIKIPRIQPCPFVGVPEPDINSGSQCYLCRCGPSSSHLPFVVFNEMMIDSDFFSYHPNVMVWPARC